jgi:hypothetical protein
MKLILAAVITLIAIAYWFIRNASTPERLPDYDWPGW